MLQSQGIASLNATRMRYIRLLLVSVCTYIPSVYTALAHGGGLDSSGGHNCYVGACAGTYHYHQNGDFSLGGLLFVLAIIYTVIWLYWKGGKRDTHKAKEAINAETPSSHRTPARTAKSLTNNNKQVVSNTSKQAKTKQYERERTAQGILSNPHVKLLTNEIQTLQSLQHWPLQGAQFYNWLIGYVMMWVAHCEQNKAHMPSLETKYEEKMNAYRALHPQIDALFAKVLSHSHIVILRRYLSEAVIFDLDFISGTATASRDWEHLKATGEYRQSITTAISEVGKPNSAPSFDYESLGDNHTDYVDPYFKEVEAWLINKIDQNTLSTELKNESPVVFETLSHKLEPGDSVWQYTTPTEYWESLCGRTGYAVVRGDRVIFAIDTIIN